MTERGVLAANAALQWVAVVVIVVLANMLAAGLFFRFDLTRDRMHSLDDASKALVTRLDRPLIVRAYVSSGLEAPYNNHEQAIRDKLEEFAAYSNGKMRVTVVDPKDDPTLVAEAQRYGLQPLTYTVHTADRAELRKIWMGAALLYGDRTDVLPALTDLGTLEYSLAESIHRLETKVEDTPILAWSVGHGEPDPTRPEGPLKDILAALSQRFYVQPVELGGPGVLDERVDALLVLGPQTPLPDRALWQIDQFLLSGKGVALFPTSTRPDLRTMRPVRVASGLEPLLGFYGVQVNRDLVLDRVQNGQMRLPTRQGDKVVAQAVNFPLLPRAVELSRRNPLTSGLESMLFPFASSVQLADPMPPGVKGEVLARSSDTSGSVQSLKTIDPGPLANVLSSEKRGPFDLLVALTGTWRSFFESRAAPAVDPSVPEEQDGLAPEKAPLVEGAPARLVVAGSADFVVNNQAFLSNLADWLVQDEALIGIRSKLAAVPPLQPTTPAERAGWRVWNLLAGPAVLLVYGAVRQARFRRRKGVA